MINFLPSALLMIISTFLVTTNIVISLSLITLVGIIKLILPFTPLQTIATKAANILIGIWGRINTWMIRLINKVEWDIKFEGEIKKDSWYLLVSNHHSWADIVFLFTILSKRTPTPKFFVKQELLYVPFVGSACWALEMPFMKRYSREKLKRKPHLKGKDVASTKKACAKAKRTPTTIVNFAEGTRFTKQKHAHSQSPYQYLLAPKSGGLAFALSSMGSSFSQVLNVTIIYPDNQEQPFKDLLKGKLKRVVIRVEALPVTADLQGDYENDPAFKQHFQQWVSELWQRKDRLIDHYYQQSA